MLPFFVLYKKAMQNEFFHTPFAEMLASVGEKKEKDSSRSSHSFRAQSKKSLSITTLSPKKSVSSPTSFVDDEELFFHTAQHCAEDEQLFLRAVQHMKPQKKQKHDSFLSLSAHFPTYAQQNSPKVSQQRQKKKQHSKQPLSQKETLQHRAQEDISMQALLDAQRPGFMGKKEICQYSTLDEEVFSKAMQDVLPLQGKGREVVPEVCPALTPEQRQECFASMMEKKWEFSLSLKGEYLEGHVVGLDELTMNNLRRGVYSPEAHLDLHGLNALQAYTALVGFFRTSWYKGLRTVLLVPGRGKNSPNGFGVLRDKLQLWLTQDPFKRVVLAFCTAQPLDGGAGTMYVLLRKYKKKGKINWERLPADPDLY